MRIRRLAAIATLLAIGLIFLTVSGVTDPSKDEGDKALNWVKYDEGLKLAKKEKKPVFVEFFTNWCKFCKKMEKETYSDKTISEYLSEHFIMVKVNAESKNTVDTPDGSLSERQLARSFSVRGYPALWFLKSNGEKIFYYPGYLPADKFIYVLRYIGEGHYESTSFRDFIAGLSAN